ncbi:hypothetical protein V2J09_013297 [Rumex salicifolius]
MEQQQALATEAVDLPLHSIGFELEEITSELVSGRLLVTQKCCQPFKVLHGGVSALIAEALGSIGAHVACGLNRVAGVHLSINHVKSAMLGDLLRAQATPVSVGRTIQVHFLSFYIKFYHPRYWDRSSRSIVWEVRIWRTDELNSTSKTLVSTARVTLLCNMPVPDHAKDSGDGLRRYAKL